MLHIPHIYLCDSFHFVLAHQNPHVGQRALGWAVWYEIMMVYHDLH